MGYQDLSRSKALSNIPHRKLQEKIDSIKLECDSCSGLKTHCNKCHYKIIAYNRYFESNIPIEYWDLEMESNFQGQEILLKKYYELTQDLKKTYVNGTSYCFAGTHGVGKTMTTCCVLKKASHKNFSCLYTTLSDIVSTLTTAPNEEKYSSRKELLSVDFLVIDEFDNRFMSSESSSDLFGRMLESIFRTRSQNKLSTLMCTNSPNVVESFSGSIKQSIDSLSKGYLRMIPVIGIDFRKSKGTV